MDPADTTDTTLHQPAITNMDDDTFASMMPSPQGKGRGERRMLGGKYNSLTKVTDEDKGDQEEETFVHVD